MAYTYELPNMSEGMDSALVGISTSVPIFVPMFLLFVYAVIMIGGSIQQRNRTGYSDIPLWSTIGFIGTLMVALPMTLVAGVINSTYLVIIVILTILSGMWLFLDNNRNEVN
jgi:hypothetical protein